jgi:hypothetical protein
MIYQPYSLPDLHDAELHTYDLGFRKDEDNLSYIYNEEFDLRIASNPQWTLNQVITASEATEIYQVSQATIRNYLSAYKPAWSRKLKGTWIMIRKFADEQWGINAV